MPERRRTTASLILASVLALACATSGTTPQTEARESGGFVIVESASVDGAVRADFERALRLLAENRSAEGVQLLVRVTESAPELTTAFIDLGIACGQVGDLERAEAALERAHELSPRHPVVLNELGMLYRRTGRFEKARASYERAIELHPEFHFARRNLAILCEVYLSDLPCALAEYERYAQAVPGDQAAPIWIADLRRRMENGEPK